MTSTAFLLALLIAASVGAQTIIPRERPATADREGKFTGDLARKVMDQFAACVLDRKRKLVMQALAMPSDSPEQNELFGKFARVDCIASAELRFSGPGFRGSLYKALVRKQFGRREIFAAPAPGASAEAVPDANGRRVSGEPGYLKFASCVIHSDPANARDAILSTAGSPNEDAAVVALQKVYGQCLYEDDTLQLPKAMLLGFLAEAYYRDGNAAAP